LILPYTTRAARDVVALISHYIDKGRPEAVGVLFRALSNASAAIRAGTAASLPAPRPYPAVVRPTWVWMKAGSYWVAYRRRPTMAITAVLHEAADIPGRV
jgi:plasmid stabilization system protein ParE